jgi:hypothetical protein
MENHSILAGSDTIIPLYYTSRIGMIATITEGIFILILLSLGIFSKLMRENE